MSGTESPQAGGSPRRAVAIVGAVLGVVLVVAALVGAAVHGRGQGGAGAGPTVVSGTVTLPVVAPEYVVAAFLHAVKAGDCARQERYVTAELIKRSGGCTTGDATRHMRWTISDPTVDPVTGIAVVPFEVSDTGSQEGREFGLVIRGGKWRIDDFHAEVTSTPTD